MRTRTLKSVLAGSVCALALTTGAHAENREFSVPAGELSQALDLYIRQSGEQLIYRVADVRGMKTSGVSGELSSEEALARLLEGTALTVKRDPSGLIAVASVDAQTPQSGSAAGDGAEGTVEALIVTAQKREEDIQDVPIAISAFTQEQLDRSQVAGGPDLMTQVPNMTFTKTNFTGYSIQLRGIGTQAISATTDPAVAVAFNNTPFIRNRFFEQEFYDLQRVEVLRGPQGTLYGRNATAGVVNLISNKPKLGVYEAMLSADVANYSSTRIAGMLNIPLAEDVASLRLAGAWTKREGYAFNEITGTPIDGRDLWSTRVSLRFSPTDALDVNLIWEHFEEDDDRLRSGKQLCNRHLPETIAGAAIPYGTTAPGSNNGTLYETYFSQGCQAASLYSPDSFQAPVGLRLPYYRPLAGHALPIVDALVPGGPSFDPYASTTQSRDLRVIESTVDPHYAAETDLVELQFSYDITDKLTLSSETGFLVDTIFSTQDYNRFSTAPGAFKTSAALISKGILDADGFFCDPQIGCANRVVAVDLSTADSHHYSQELRLASNYDGPFNFSLGANFLRYDTEDKYYVFINTLTLSAVFRPSGMPDFPGYVPNVSDNSWCLPEGLRDPDVTGFEDIGECVYVDPNPIGALNDLGHNYFLSRNPYKLISYAVFGEAYYNITDALKVTAGLRWTVDKKQAPRIPSWTFAANSAGYPVAEVIEQEWREPTGRLTIDWKPDLGFTDETLLYGSYAHGYKAGGANPPAAGLVMRGGGGADFQLLAKAQAAVAPRTFEGEFVEAFEVGSKNTLLDGSMTLNLAAFYYDYKGYQISQIVNRAAINYNFDATVWGLEIEADWRPLENLRFGFKGGYEHTEVADGQSAVDTMDRANGGQPDENGVIWYVTGPFPTFPSNCILPAYTVVRPNGVVAVHGGPSGGNLGACETAYVLGKDPMTGQTYVANPPLANYSYPGYPGFDPYTAPNGGAGFSKDLSGNELPNAPHFTATLTADYTAPLPNDWLATLHTDLYYQSEAWTRIFNTEGYDKLKAYTNVNLAAIFTNETAGWKVMAYVKNVFDRDSITGAFLNSDDTGLTTNVFLTEPRLYGLRVTKEWNGGPWWTGANLNHIGPFPLTVELSGQVQRQDAPNETMRVDWADQLPAGLALDNLQDRDLDWGDGRSVKLTYRPNGSPWSISGSMRYGRTNSDTSRDKRDFRETLHVCRMTPNHPFAFACDPASPPGYYFQNWTNIETVSWSDAEARAHEEHDILDFAVGYDVGLGGLPSTVSAGIRHAKFGSHTHWAANAQGDWIVPVGWAQPFPAKYTSAPSSFRRHHATLDAEREFSGTGPAVSWDSAVTLWEDEQAGRLTVDWSVTGGVLFGKHKTFITGEDQDVTHSGEVQTYASVSYDRSIVRAILPVASSTTIPIAVSRSKDVTVPSVDLSLGLSYDVGRIKIGAGYRWEQYFDVLDVGYEEAKDADRTIDGPYFKIAVGFGG